MDRTPDLPGKQTSNGSALAGGVKRRSAHTRRNVAITLWIIGFIALLVASVIVSFHPAPWPFDLQTTITLQQLQLPPWVDTPIAWVSIVDNVLPSLISYVVWFVGLSLIGVGAWRRGRSPVPWFVTAIFVSLVPGIMNGLDGLIALIVARPRPSPRLIHVFMPVPVHSFPSGHVENDVVYFGFLLYLSLTKPVREWRYRWILLPFQIFGLMAILLIGFSRLYEGEHWLTDVLGGYLSGALWLFLFIWLYRWTTDKLARRKMEKQSHQQLQSQV